MSAPVDETSAESTPAATPDVAPPGARPRRRRVWQRALLTLLVLLVVATGWLVFRGAQAAIALVGAGQVVTEVRTGLSDVDTQAIAARVPDLQADAARARGATSDPVWRAAAHLPVVGPNFAAVATVSAALDDIASVAQPTLDGIDTIVGALSSRGDDGRIDLAPIADAAPSIARAATTVATAEASVAGIDPGHLVGPLAGPVERVQAGLSEMAGLFDAAAEVSSLAPPMLGADGPRTYLLLSLNSAELRSAGGIVGVVAELRAEDGKLDLVDQRTTADIRSAPAPVLPLSDAELRVHTDRLGRWLQDTVLTPDFPRTAELVSQFWRNNDGGEVDGVISMDPVVIAYLLKATGAVVEPGGMRLDSDNVLHELLRESYLRLPDPLEGDAFYKGVAAAIFGAVASGQGDAQRLMEELGRAGGEHRVRMWSVHPQEQRVLAQTPVGGAFLSGGADEAAGVFLNDGTAGKVDYFLRTDVSVEEVRCGPTSTTAVVRLDLAYDPPADIADFPVHVTGTSNSGLPTGWVATNITVYAPVGGALGSTRLGDRVVGGRRAAEGGREVEVLTSRLAPGERATYRFEIRTPGPAPELPFWLTPTLTSPGALAADCG